jgi:hypothetical protein
MSSQEYQARIEKQLGGMLTGETTGSVTGGQFSFDEAAMKQIIANWKELANSYNDSIRNARRMVQVTPPAEDFASVGFVNTANESGQSYLSYLEHNRDYCKEQAQLFQHALDDYLGVEERTVIEFNDAAESGPRPGL